MRTPRYETAVAWIANEDEPTVLDVEEMAGLISVALVADLFGCEAEQVAADVVAYRKLDEHDDRPRGGKGLRPIA